MSAEGSSSGGRKKRSAPPRIRPEELDRAVQDSFLKVKMMPESFGDQPALVVDADQVFLLYATFCGDIPKTAHAADLSLAAVAKLVADNGWEERVRGLVELKKGDKAGEVERGISRAMNFVQAHRMRMYIERIIRELTSDTKENLFDRYVVDKVNKEGAVVGSTLSFKPLSDLAAALEKIHWMTYQALVDAPQDRAQRKPKNIDEDAAETDIHARISSALQKMREASPKAQLEDAQADMAAHLSTTSSITMPSA